MMVEPAGTRSLWHRSQRMAVAAMRSCPRMALAARQAPALGGSVPVVTERVTRQIHVLMTLAHGGVPVPGEIHVMALHAGRLAAFPIRVIFVRERDAVAIQIAVDPKPFAAARLMYRCRLDAAARRGDCGQEREPKGRGQHESQRIHGARGDRGDAQPGASTGFNSGSFSGSASGSAGRCSHMRKRSIMNRKSSAAPETMPALMAISVHAGR